MDDVLAFWEYSHICAYVHSCDARKSHKYIPKTYVWSTILQKSILKKNSSWGRFSVLWNVRTYLTLIIPLFLSASASPKVTELDNTVFEIDWLLYILLFAINFPVLIVDIFWIWNDDTPAVGIKKYKKHKMRKVLKKIKKEDCKWNNNVQIKCAICKNWVELDCF